MDETLLLTVQGVGQAGDDVLIFPSLPADQYHFDGDIEKIKIKTPDNQIVEKDADFSIPLGTSSSVYLLLIHNTLRDEVPVGSQIWIMKSLEQITRKADPTDE